MGKRMDMMNAEIAATNKLISAHQHAENKQRRERIATAILPAMLEYYGKWAHEHGHSANWRAESARDACDIADALIAELDREQPQEVEP